MSLTGGGSSNSSKNPPSIAVTVPGGDNRGAGSAPVRNNSTQTLKRSAQVAAASARFEGQICLFSTYFRSFHLLDFFFKLFD